MIKILVAKPGMDSHDRGAVVLCHAFRDAGMEAIYTGLWQTPEMIVSAAIQEDVDVIAVSMMDGNVLAIFSDIIEGLKKKCVTNIAVMGGGIIPENIRPKLSEMGISGFFGPGTPMEDIVNHIKSKVKKSS
ncbi:MAG: cobalamin B12-binding domain-containing protein [Syntrophales bacterium]